LEDVEAFAQLNKKDKNKDKVEIGDRVLTVEDIVAVIREIIRLNNDRPPTGRDRPLGHRRVRTLTNFW